MWNLIAKYAVRIAMWAVEHPDKVKDIVDTVVAAKSEVSK
jgi:hypothetical protein